MYTPKGVCRKSKSYYNSFDLFYQKIKSEKIPNNSLLELLNFDVSWIVQGTENNDIDLNIVHEKKTIS